MDSISLFPNIPDSMIEEVYQDEKANYLIEDSKENSKLCVIYFSGHGLFFPETTENFRRVIVDENRFEWYKHRFDGTSKSIFVRDICKNFYVEGINSKYDSVDSLCDFLAKESAGYEVVTIGSSAGGYAAVLFGCLLKAKRVYSFSGQIDLWNYFDFPNKKLLQKSREESAKAKYYNLVDLLDSAESTTVVYFTPAHCKEDIYQVEQLRKSSNNKIVLISIKSRRHGVPVLRESLPFVWQLEESELLKAASKPMSLLAFTMRCGGGLGVWTMGVTHSVTERIGRRLRRIVSRR